MAPTLAVLTGAGIGGIGYAVAAHLASLGTRVVLADIDASALLGARLALIQGGAKDEDVLSVRSDVSCIENMLLLRGAVKKWGGKEPDFLFLNAGVQLPSKSIGTDGPDVDAWKSILDVNLYGVINGVQTFAEGMIKQSTATGTKAQIVITGSKQGITAPPGNPAYNVSKAAVKVLAESLAHSLLPTPLVTAHLLVPGYTFTKLTSGGTAKSLDAKPKAAWTSEQVSDELFKRIDKEFYIICPDNDVHEKLDMARMEWSAGDIQNKRPALSRWNPEYKQEFEAFIAKRVAE